METKQFRFRVGFVGSGNMAEAICRSMINDAFYKPIQIAAYDASEERRKYFHDKFGVYVCKSNVELVDNSEHILLAVKPQVMPKVLEEIKPAIGPGQKIISIAAGISTKYIETSLDRSVPVVRVMPNTPLMVGAGTIALAAGQYAGQDDLNFARTLFAASGVVITLEERLIDAVTAISGSGPAYFFYFIEAMVQAGIEMGLTPEHARILACNTALGSAKMVTTLSDSPAELRRKVTSPAGTTEAAIKVMDQTGMKQHFIDAMNAAAARSRELGK
jgi:pyrroline-5-carboxylate reductase